MGTTVRRWRLRTVASVLAAGTMALTGAVLPSAAQQPDPTAPDPTAASSTTSTTSAGTATTSPGPTTSEPSDGTTAPPSSVPEVPTSPAPPPSAGTGTIGTTDGSAPAADPAGPGPAVPLAASVTLDPADDLVDGSAVTVTATGLTPGSWARVVQCPAGALYVYDDCGPSESDSYTEIDGSGTLTRPLRVQAVIWGGWGSTEPVDCRTADACIVAVSDDHGSVVASAPLPLVADGPLAPPPVASVSPTEPLAHMQQVTVSASGLVWGYTADVLQCAADPVDRWADCDDMMSQRVTVADDGTLSTTFVASAVISIGTGENVDCRVPGACTLAVTPDGMRSPAKMALVPLVFDPAAEVIPPTLTVTPNADLVDGQTVRVTGSGFAPGWIDVQPCAGATQAYDDDCLWTESYADVGVDGTFSLDVPVRVIIPTPSGEIDCRTSEHPCLLIASRGAPNSVHAARAELHFDPDGPVPPAPSITVSPDTDLPDEATVTVSGTHFASPEWSDAYVDVCAVGDNDRCDMQAETAASPTNAGAFSVEVGVAATFEAWSGPVDCRVAPGCEIVARIGSQGRRTTAPLTFAPAGGPGERYLDAVFDEVDVTSDVVYRHTADATGAGVDLTLDIYEPAGDTEEQRPVVVWLPGGWFSGLEQADMAAYAEAFAQRGYVAVTMDYRQRPGLQCCPTDDVEGVTAAITDAAGDAAAGVAWLRDHAADHGIDPDAIAVGGHEAGAAAAFGLAHLPGAAGSSGSADVAAVLPIAGVDLGRPDAGESPFLAFNDRGATTAPAHLSASACARARSAGTACGAVAYNTLWSSELAQSRQRDIVRRSADFLAEIVLDPLGYLEWTGPTTPTGPTGPGGAGSGGGSGGGSGPVPTPAAVLQPAAAVVAVAAQAGGTLPRTGAGLARLVAIALGLGVIGGACLLARRRQLQAGSLDAGSLRLAGAAVLATVALVVGGFVAVNAMEPTSSDDDTEDAAGDPGHDGDHDHEADEGDDHDDADHDEADGHALGTHGTVQHGTGEGHDGDHDDTDHDGTDHDDRDHDDRDHDDGDGDDGHGDGDDHGVAGTPAGADHGHGTGPTAPGDPTHPHPTEPTDPTHPHPTVPTDPTDPDLGFDPSWTPEQVAYARALIDDTAAGLEQYANQGVLPLIGYQWISDGKGIDEYQHWIHISRIADARVLDPDVPESLVFRNSADGPVLEASMYMLGLGYNLGNIPADIAWLPGWHIHDNLCFVGNFELVGVTVNGQCERGHILPTPPMLHVWIVDTRCGRFAGVDENGLQCHHEH